MFNTVMISLSLRDVGYNSAQNAEENKNKNMKKVNEFST